VPALVVAEGDVILIAELGVNDGVVAVPLTGGVLAREALVLNTASGG
jgi:hypothetical protein